MIKINIHNYNLWFLIVVLYCFDCLFDQNRFKIIVIFFMVEQKLFLLIYI